MSTTVLLIRHGQTEANVSGYYMGRSNEDLNEDGHNQVLQLASRLAQTPLDIIYTSPLKRTYTTARIIAKPHKLIPNCVDEFIEINLGDWEGLHANEIINRWPDLWQQSRVDPSMITWPHGESFKKVAERAIRSFEKIVCDNQDRQVAIVTHDIIVRILVAHVLEVSHSMYRKIEISNASVTSIRVTDNKRILITLNDISHLGDSK